VNRGRTFGALEIDHDATVDEQVEPKSVLVYPAVEANRHQAL
jgi:hypothetical protein